MTLFDEYKTVNLVCNILEKSKNNTENYVKIIHLLYLIDRRMIELHDQVMTRDHYASMTMGPVLCSTLCLIGQHPCEIPSKKPDYWSIYIKSDKTTVSLRHENQRSHEFSPMEARVIEQVLADHGAMSPIESIKYMTNPDNIPEWTDPRPYGILQLPICRILRFLGKGLEVYQALEERYEVSLF